MFGVCPKCRTAYSWDVPRFSCSCGHMSDMPPTDMPTRDYTALGRSPFAPTGWWGADRDRDRDRDRDLYGDRDQTWDKDRASRPRNGTPRNGVNSHASTDLDRERSRAEHERDLEREQRRRERTEQQWERRDRGRDQGRGRGRGRGRK